jgi:hypothetical protein
MKMTFLLLKVAVTLTSMTGQPWATGTGFSLESQPSAPVIHKFTWRPGELRQNEAPPCKESLFPIEHFRALFLEIMQLLVEETSRY